MDFVTDSQLEMLLLNGSDENRDKDNYPVAKLIAAEYKAVWLLIDIDPDDKEFAFALYDSGNGFPEFKYVSLPLLKDASDKLQLDVRHDESFQAKYPISVYAKAARQSDFITDEHNVLAPIAQEQEGQIITSCMTIEEIDIRPKLKAFFADKNLATKKENTVDSLDQKLSKLER